MRVLAIAGRPLDSLGGAERSLARLCRALARRCEVLVLVPGGGLPFDDAGGVALARLDPDDPAATFARIRDAGGAPDIVYLSDKALIREPARLAALVAAFPRARVVFKESTDGKLLKRLAALPPAAAEEVERSIRAVVCVSARIRESFERSGLFDGRLASIPNGVDTEVFRPAAEGEREEIRARLGLPPAVPTFLFAGRFAEKKNLDVVYGAWLDRERRQGPGARLVLVGRAHKHYDEGILRLLREDLRSVTFAGPFRTDEEMLPFYRACDFFLAPTSREGLSNAFLEAAACGLYPVVSRASGYADVVADERSGILVEERNTSAVIRALDAILADPDEYRRRGVEHAREAVRRGFDLASVAARYLELFRGLA